MGDRGNIIIRQRDGDVWFYTHWSGSEMPAVVQRALSRKQRWSDEAYLARIVFSELVGQKQWADETGFGISTGMADNEHMFIVVDVPNQRVATIKDESNQLPRPYTAYESWTFEEYIALKADCLPEV